MGNMVMQFMDSTVYTRKYIGLAICLFLFFSWVLSFIIYFFYACCCWNTAVSLLWNNKQLLSHVDTGRFYVFIFFFFVYIWSCIVNAINFCMLYFVLYNRRRLFNEAFLKTVSLKPFCLVLGCCCYMHTGDWDSLWRVDPGQHPSTCHDCHPHMHGAPAHRTEGVQISVGGQCLHLRCLFLDQHTEIHF